MIELNSKNIAVACDSLDMLTNTINKYSKSIKGKEFNKNKLALIDLIMRNYPNLRAINSLLLDFRNGENTGNFLPVGLLMRCCLEDILQIVYLLIFVDDSDILECEINIKSAQAIGKNFEGYIKSAPEYWTCPQEEKEKLKEELHKQYFELKAKHSYLFNSTTAKTKKAKDFRRECANPLKYFNDGNGKIIENETVKFYFETLKKHDKEFSYIYLLYKHFCLFEHYSFITRNAPIPSNQLFLQLVISIEYVQRGVLRALVYLAAEEQFLEDIVASKSKLQTLIK